MAVPLPHSQRFSCFMEKKNTLYVLYFTALFYLRVLHSILLSLNTQTTLISNLTAFNSKSTLGSAAETALERNIKSFNLSVHSFVLIMCISM